MGSGLARIPQWPLGAQFWAQPRAIRARLSSIPELLPPGVRLRREKKPAVFVRESPVLSLVLPLETPLENYPDTTVNIRDTDLRRRKSQMAQKPGAGELQVGYDGAQSCELFEGRLNAVISIRNSIGEQRGQTVFSHCSER